MNEIKEIVNIRKGNDYNIDLNKWEFIKFSRLGEDVIKRIHQNLKQFFPYQKKMKKIILIKL